MPNNNQGDGVDIARLAEVVNALMHAQYRLRHISKNNKRTDFSAAMREVRRLEKEATDMLRQLGHEPPPLTV